MYIMTRGPRPNYRLHKAAASALSVFLVAGALVGGLQYFDAETKISDTPPPVVTKVLAAETKVKTFDAGVLSLSLPKDWEPFNPADTPDTAYSWQSTGKSKGVERLTAYIDTVPPQFAVNRVLAVEGEGDRIQQLGGVSENCVDFVEGGRNPSQNNGKTPARWSGVQFLCDNGNPGRHVAGIASQGDMTGVKLTGPSGTHRVFLVYNDANYTPNYTIFTNAVESLRLH